MVFVVVTTGCRVERSDEGIFDLSLSVDISKLFVVVGSGMALGRLILPPAAVAAAGVLR